MKRNKIKNRALTGAGPAKDKKPYVSRNKKHDEYSKYLKYAKELKLSKEQTSTRAQFNTIKAQGEAKREPMDFSPKTIVMRQKSGGFTAKQTAKQFERLNELHPGKWKNLQDYIESDGFLTLEDDIAKLRLQNKGMSSADFALLVSQQIFGSE